MMTRQAGRARQRAATWPYVALLAVVAGLALPASASAAPVSPVQAAVTVAVARWSHLLVTAYRHQSPAKWTAPALGVNRDGLQVVGLALNASGSGGTWVLEDVLKQRQPGGVLLPGTSDSIAVHRIGSSEHVSYFAQVTADVDSVHDHAWAISIEDLDTLQCDNLGLVSFWCSQGPTMTTRRSRTFGERPISLAGWHLVEAQMQHEINAALRLAPIHGPVLPNLPEQFFAGGSG
jgi:hypothetical protein